MGIVENEMARHFLDTYFGGNAQIPVIAFVNGMKEMMFSTEGIELCKGQELAIYKEADCNETGFMGLE